MDRNVNPPANWPGRLRLALGYLLFAAAVVYALRRSPDSLASLQWGWLVAAAGVMVAMLVLQMAQVVVFLRCHAVRNGRYWPLMFAVKKGILNSVLPARTGTLVLMYMLTRYYPVTWRQYLTFGIVAAVVSLAVSAVALAWLLTPPVAFIGGVSALVGGVYLMRRFPVVPYARALPQILLIGFGLYGTMLLAFWCILRAMGVQIGLRDASYFAVALNILSQLSITPGNMGVRELLMGAVAPYLTLSAATGILAGGIFHVIRTVVYAVCLGSLEVLALRYPTLKPKALEDSAPGA
ncbi:MAG TPA: hypothetical protein VGA00_07940 [Acidiferrobacterales bacterium]